jgi:hypothetical protein
VPDNRFPGAGVDARFPSAGRDARFELSGVDARFRFGGVDTRFTGSVYGHPAFLGDAIDPFLALSGVLAWWDAGYGYATGSTVYWTDRKQGLRLGQSLAASQPVWGATSYNGAPGVTFDGVDDRLTEQSAGLLPSTAGFPIGAAAAEIWAVVQQNTPGASATTTGIFSYGGTSANASRSLHRAGVAGTNRLRATTGTGASSVSATDASAAFSSRHVARAIFGATTTEVEIDDSVHVTGAAVPATGDSRIRMGDNASGGNYTACTVRHCLVVDPTLLTAQNTIDLRALLVAYR